MGCGCRKNKTGQAATATKPVARVSTRKKASQVRKDNSHLAPPQGNFYTRTMYFVFPTGSEWDDEEARRFPTLAEAQKTQRDLGPGWSVAARRP